MATGYMGSGDMGKGLYAAPMGLPTDEMGPPLEIEIENPDEVNIGIGDMEINLKPQKETAEDFDANLAEYLDDSELASLASELIDDFDKDNNDRKEWMQTYVEGLKLLGLKYEERTEPWLGEIGRAHV